MELNDDLGAWEARQTIKEVEKTQPADEKIEDVEEVGKDTQSEENNVLMERIAAIDKRLLKINFLYWLLIGIIVAAVVLLFLTR